MGREEVGRREERRGGWEGRRKRMGRREKVCQPSTKTCLRVS